MVTTHEASYVGGMSISGMSGALLVRVVAETARHAGHADILRETIDGHTGSSPDDVGDDEWWAAYLARIRESADAHRA